MKKLHQTCFFGNNKKWELELSKKNLLYEVCCYKHILELKIKMNGDL